MIVEAPLVALARSWVGGGACRGGSSPWPVSRVCQRAARRTADEAEAARRPVRELLVGGCEPGEVDADVLAVAALSLLGNLVRELVAVADLDVAREWAAAFGRGRHVFARGGEPAGQATGAVLVEVIQSAPVGLGLPIPPPGGS